MQVGGCSAPRSWPARALRRGNASQLLAEVDFSDSGLSGQAHPTSSGAGDSLEPTGVCGPILRTPGAGVRGGKVRPAGLSCDLGTGSLLICPGLCPTSSWPRGPPSPCGARSARGGGAWEQAWRGGSVEVALQVQSAFCLVPWSCTLTFTFRWVGPG